MIATSSVRVPCAHTFQSNDFKGQLAELLLLCDGAARLDVEHGMLSADEAIQLFYAAREVFTQRWSPGVN